MTYHFVTGTALLFIALLGQVGKGETPEDFKALLGELEGVWLGESQIEEEIGEFAKAGSTVPIYFDIRGVVDGKAAELDFRAGTSATRGMMFFDPSANEIRLVWTNTEGVSSQEKIERSGKSWKYTGKRSLPGQDALDVLSDITVAGDRLEVKSEVGGEELPLLKAKRIHVPGVTETPSLLQEFGKQFVGRWVRDISWIRDWDGAPGGTGAKAVGYEEFRWAAGGQVIEHICYAGEFKLLELYYWDAERSDILGFHASGTGIGGSFKVKRRPDGSWAYVITGGCTADGEAIGGAVHWQFENEGNVLRTSGVISLDGENSEPLADVYYRVSPR